VATTDPDFHPATDPHVAMTKGATVTGQCWTALSTTVMATLESQQQGGYTRLYIPDY